MVLHYGTGERAEFSSTPTLFYRKTISIRHTGDSKSRWQGEVLGMRRTIMEFQSLLHEPALRTRAVIAPVHCLTGV